MVDAKSFMRYNGESTGQLQPLDGPISSEHLDVMQELADPDDNLDYAPPAVQLMQHMARRARRRFASGQPAMKGSSPRYF